jgi:hypothetical protein
LGARSPHQYARVSFRRQCTLLRLKSSETEKT